ncbi:type IV pilus assembly protein [Pandoraea morbifera]|uniref:Type IV pilus assembly protein n=1 Tax=Pandoraea morbifera TaxID=2508300 RepID=A0A5E4TH07_9BURK|nr:toxin co-regulated pilus biosynthesis Q family protein [Pandoraea morbifera]VVD87316.1 type IV pilus assembly protein [Pandoraea morbifera]
MTLSGMRIASLLAALGSGMSPVHALEAGAPASAATWTFASHKPLTQAAAAESTTPAHRRPSQATQTLRAGDGDLPPASVDGARRFVASPASLPPSRAAGLELVLRPADGRVSQAMRRYAERHGWQLAWEIERDFPIEYPATFRGDFLGIVEQIVRSLQNTDAPIRVKVYDANRVLRVVHATQ